MDCSNLDVIKKFFEAYGNHNSSAIHQVMAENVRCIFPGSNRFSGIRRGIEEVIAFFDSLRKLDVQQEQFVLGTSNTYVMECHRIRSKGADGCPLDASWGVLWKFEKGKITECRHFTANQRQIDDFFRKLVK